MLLDNLDEYRGQFESDGFIKVEGLFNARELDQIELELVEFRNRHQAQLRANEINFASGDKSQINSLHALNREPGDFFTSLMSNENVKTISDYLLRDEAVGRKVEYFAKPARVGMPSPIHQDNYYWCYVGGNALTVWVSLDRSHYGNGGVHYLRGSHKAGLLDHKASFAPGSSQTLTETSCLANYDAVCMHLKPGDAFFHHSLTVHWSEANRSEESRRGLTLQYFGKNETVDQERIKQYEKSLMEQVHLRERS